MAAATSAFPLDHGRKSLVSRSGSVALARSLGSVTAELGTPGSDAQLDLGTSRAALARRLPTPVAPINSETFGPLSRYIVTLPLTRGAKTRDVPHPTSGPSSTTRPDSLLHQFGVSGSEYVKTIDMTRMCAFTLNQSTTGSSVSRSASSDPSTPFQVCRTCSSVRSGYDS